MMNETQRVLIKIANEFKRICESNNLRYFLSYGSLLGAIRHKGFIPWDDDIDFLMPRDDYEKFLAIAPQMLKDTQYALRDFSQDGKNYSFPFAKIDDTKTTLIELSQANFFNKSGIYIDIFPLDGTFNSKTMQKLHVFTVSKLVRLREIAFTARIKSKKQHFRNFIIKVLRKTCRGNTLLSFIHFFAKIKSYQTANYVGNLVWGYGQKDLMNKNIYKKSKQVQFENIDFSAPLETNEYLTQIYGEYMQLPPEQERISQHPTFFFDINLPYKDYKYENL